MKKILVVDDMAIFREPIAQALRSVGYDVACASDGGEALIRLRDSQPHLVLLDMVMPGLDGLAVLRTMRSNPSWRSIPVIMLTDKSDRECVSNAASHHVQGYILKSKFSLKVLLERVESCLGQLVAAGSTQAPEKSQHEVHARSESAGDNSPPARTTTSPADTQATRNHGSNPPPSPAPQPTGTLDDLKPLITKNELFKLITKGLELRPLGPAVQSVMKATSTAACSAEDVGRAVSQDQALSIRILKIANSSAFSRGRSVDSVKEAVQRIGVSEVRRMVMALGVIQKYEESSIKYLDPRLFWEHSTACGLFAAAIAKARQDKNPDEYFLRGTLHDIGRMILFEHAPDAYTAAWEAAEQLDLPLELVEPKLMGSDHCEILERALEHWQFPSDFIKPVVSHHRSIGTIRRLGGQHAEAAATVALADRLAHAMLLGSSGNDVLYPLDELAQFLSLSPKVLAEIAAKVFDETHDLKFSMLARAQESTWPDCVLQAKERLGVPLQPLYLGPDSEMDAFRMFLERVVGTNEGTPNIAFIHLAQAGDLTQKIKELEVKERSSEVGNLPLLVIAAKPNIQVDQALFGKRRNLMHPMPMRIATLIRNIRELLQVAQD